MSEPTSQKILLVDDNAKVLKLLELRFTQHGYQVFTAERVKDAVVTAIIVKPHIIVSEFNLPDLKGADFRNILGSIPAVAEVPILFISSEKELPGDLHAEPGAPVDHLQKPYTFQELLTRIEANLHRATLRKSAMNAAGLQKGVLREMTLTDILQVLAMNKRSCTITLKQEDRVGKIYFQSGRIVDAKAPGLRAEEALYHLISWRGADFSIGDEQHDSMEETVTQDTHLLIADVLKRLARQEDKSDLTVVEQNRPAVQEDAAPRFDQGPKTGLGAEETVEMSLPPEHQGSAGQQDHNGEGSLVFSAPESAEHPVPEHLSDQGEEQAFLSGLASRGLLKPIKGQAPGNTSKKAGGRKDA